MARGKTQKLYRTFVKGLITEAGFLTYPEDASTDELNTILSSKGTRSRRLGFQYEPSGAEVTITGEDQDSVTSEFTWRAVANKADSNFLVVQVGTVLHFFSLNEEPISTHKKSFTVDMESYLTPAGTAEGLRTSNVQMDSGKGFLFVVNENIEPLVIEYLPDTDTISVIRVVIQIRDFDGLSDGLSNDAEPTTLNKEHFYNLRNQGWISS